MTLFALAGVFGVLSGMALVGITTSADANIGNGYTLLSIAGVILGGGEFVGGSVSPIGAVLGALTMAMAASPLLTFMHIPPDWQVAANGAILIIVLAARVADHPQGIGPMNAALQTLLKRPWIWSFVGAGVVWLAAIAFTGGYGAEGMLTAALSLAVFTVIVGVGQMFVITLGPGNVDLSLPANIGLASAVAMKTMGGDDRLVLVGLAAAIACGLAVGLANYLLIWALRIPPIIATLSASFIIQSIDISYGRGLQIKPPPGFADFTNIVSRGRAAAGGPDGALHDRRERRAPPHDLGPLGRRDRAEPARGAARGPQGRAGALRDLRACAARSAASTGRCSPAISAAPTSTSATNTCLASIAVVVIGGTSVSGGRANVPGVWGGALFLVLLLTMLNTFGVSAGVRLLLTGLIIVGVITAAGGEKATR